MIISRPITVVLVSASLLACGKKKLPELPISTVRDVPADSVESVIFWIGDVGKAEWGKSPLVHKLAADVEQWSRALPRDSSVGVVFLGDNVYPGGLREPGRPEFWEDSTHLEAQANVMRAANARAKNAFAVFIPGNHDWGHKFGPEGEARLRNMQQFLERRHARGINVALRPPAGSPGPAIIDVGRHIRIIIIDTAWWLLSPNSPEKLDLMARVEQAMTSADGRAVMFATHHPYKSASAHGGVVPIWSALGIKWLLYKTGAALQDLNSLPYREFITGLVGIFERRGPPLLFAGGHDHVLQVIKATEPLDPRFMLVSGAGSKLSLVGHIDGMVYRGRQPGYMRMVVKKNGRIDLVVVSADESFLTCDRGDAAATAQCLNAGINAFRNTYGMSLR
jgi:hypothetical protein